MARWRVAVAVMAPPELADDLDVLRRALGATAVDRVAPHLTLLPPVNLPEADVPAALAVVRAAARGVDPFVVSLGPVTSFEPVTPTVHLAVGTPGSADVERLDALQRAVARPPLERRVDHPFVPHVTLIDRAPLHRIHAARVALVAYADRLVVDRLTLLREARGADRVRRWHPVADVDLDGVRVVGRGGLPLELATGSLVDPEAAGTLQLGPRRPSGPVVVARREGTVVGAAWGSGDSARRATDDEVGHVLAAEWAYRRERRRAATPFDR